MLTKADKLTKPELENRMVETAAAIAKRPAAFPAVYPTSSHDGAGIPELRAAILRVLSERSPIG